MPATPSLLEGLGLQTDRASSQGARGRKELPAGYFQDRGFKIHFLVYLAVNGLLIVINLVTTPRNYWFYWPIAGLGNRSGRARVWRVSAKSPTN